jgi:hypothetical protein
MNNKFQSFTIKLALTIPALLFGLVSVLFLMFKPVIDLWMDKAQPAPVALPEEDSVSNHTFM